jgi:hypothetical protein
MCETTPYLGLPLSDKMTDKERNYDSRKKKKKEFTKKCGEVHVNLKYQNLAAG